EQGIGLGVIGDEYVRPAIVVEVRDRDAHSFAGGGGEPRLLRNIGELAVAQVVVKAVRDVDVTARIAVVVAAAHGAMDVRLRSPDGVVGNDQIQQPVVVVIEPGGGHAERVGRFAADAGGRR